MTKFVYMEKRQSPFEARVVKNIRKIMNERGLYQARLAMDADVSDKALSKILNGDQHLSLDILSKIAKAFSLREIDIITYPERYEMTGEVENSPTEVLLQMRLTKEKKDQVLKLVFGENNIEILNK